MQGLITESTETVVGVDIVYDETTASVNVQDLTQGWKDRGIRGVSNLIYSFELDRAGDGYQECNVVYKTNIHTELDVLVY